jgi:glycosyltransferase involved in cell wall biosynthesis
VTLAPVSVVIPVHAVARPFLDEAIDSVLAQDPSPTEVIVVGDGVPEPVLAVSSRHDERVVVLGLPKSTGSAALNAGISRARCELLAFLDADDVWVAGKLERQLAVLADAPEVDLVFGLIQQFVTPGAEPGLGERVIVPAGPQAGPHKSAMLIRRSSFERVGPFDADQTTTDFVDWLLRARDVPLRERSVDAIVARRRIHGQNITLIRGSELRAQTLDLLKASLDRRRARV